MRNGIITAVLGLAALGLTTLTPGTARADGRIVVGVAPPGVVVTAGSPYYYPPPVVVGPTYPVYTYPPVVVTPAPVVVAPPTVVVRGGYRYVRPILRPRFYVRIR